MILTERGRIIVDSTVDLTEQGRLVINGLVESKQLVINIPPTLVLTATQHTTHIDLSWE